jgi:hypothetical protein
LGLGPTNQLDQQDSTDKIAWQEKPYYFVWNIQEFIKKMVKSEVTRAKQQDCSDN